MTAHTPRILTEGETALVSALAEAGFSDHGDLRQKAIEALEANGLPTRRVEAFHYTDLRSMLKPGLKVAQRPSEDAAKTIGAEFPRLVSDAAVLHFRDGHFFDWGEELPEGVSVDANMPKPANESVDPSNTTGLINSAFAQSGVTVDIAENAEVSRTVGLAYAHTGVADTIAATRFAVNVGKNASCRLIERGVGRDGLRYLSSSVIDLDIGAGADVDFIISNEEGDAAQRLAQLNVQLGKDAKLNLFVLNLGGKLARQEINFDMNGEGIELKIAGVTLVGGDAHIDVTSRITHHAPHTNATETFRNVATGRGSGVFQGQINVRQAAQLTDARMACNTLLLSDDCDFSAKPELEIFADDVQCAHGATVADLEESYLFYLMARGIPEVQARRMLVRAFVAEVVEELEDEALVETLEGRIDAWMERHV
ncbi:MAG: Fe-S cluster assembly protein SufD [Pseudomonadota bacterium]